MFKLESSWDDQKFKLITAVEVIAVLKLLHTFTRTGHDCILAASLGKNVKLFYFYTKKKNK